MQRDLLFGTTIALQDGASRLGAIWLDDEWNVSAVAVEKGFLVKWMARATGDHFQKDASPLAIDQRWGELESFDAHAQAQDPHLLLPNTRIRLVERASLREACGEVRGVVADDNLHVEHLVAEVDGKKLLVPPSATLMQSQFWVYVDMMKVPGDLSEYKTVVRSA